MGRFASRELSTDEAEFLRCSREAQKQREATELEAARRLADALRERAEEAEKAQRLEEERAQEAEKRAEEQKESANKLRRRAFVTAGAAGVALILLVISVFLWLKSESASTKAEEQARIAAIQRNAAEEQAHRAEEQTRIAESRRLAAESSSALTKYPQRSLLLAVEAVKVEQQLHGVRVAADEQSLRESLSVIGGRLVARADGPITTVAISLTFLFPTAIPSSYSNSTDNPSARSNHFALRFGLVTANPKWPTVPSVNGTFMLVTLAN